MKKFSKPDSHHLMINPILIYMYNTYDNDSGKKSIIQNYERDRNVF